MKRFIATTALALTMTSGAALAQDMIDLNGMTADGTTLIIPDVQTDSAGYVVIHEAQDGAPVVPQSIGHAPVMAGDNAGVTVTLDQRLTPGATYFAMLHEETNGNQTYDFGPGSTEVDTPVMVDGAPLMNDFRAVSASQQSTSSGSMSGDAMSGDSMSDGAMSGDGSMGDGAMSGDNGTMQEDSM